jgi:PBP1b-binding outer membrane lipoprotein LpoB
MSIMKMVLAMAAAALLLSGCVSSDSSSDGIDVDANAHPECAKQFGSSSDGMSRDMNGQHACF